MRKLVISLFLFLTAAGPALAQAAATQPPATAPSPTASPPSPTASPPSPSPSAPSPSAGAPSPSPSSTRFTTEAAAKTHCPDDTVVWVASSRARVYHLSGDRTYGRSRRGAYMCQKDAQSAGMRQSRRATTSSSTSKPASTGTSPSGSTNQ
jgi:hypothetical protein